MNAPFTLIRTENQSPTAALWLPLLYAGLLLLFLPPRLVYVARGPGFPSPAGYVTLGLFLMLVGAYALAIIAG